MQNQNNYEPEVLIEQSDEEILEIKDKFYIGRVVWLNSGGNPLTVTGYETATSSYIEQGKQIKRKSIKIKVSGFINDKYLIHSKYPDTCLSIREPQY